MPKNKVPTPARIEKIAIANRGEVALRIVRACQELGISSTLLHSEADVNTPAYRQSDNQICIGPSPAPESYLSIEKTVKAAVSSGAQAVHPGFGFLSENADFAQALRDEGLIFIGPPPQAIRSMGDKIAAKKIIQQARVPTLPSFSGENLSDSLWIEEMEKMGYPVIVKATAGGGGRGMRVIENSSQALEQMASARRESQAAFGNKRVFLEKYLDSAKHVEIQIFCDTQGGGVHLFERECSVQRRHQKIIEEAPCSSLSEPLREKMTQAALRLAHSVNYVGAGTVEFLVQNNDFYFLEMNTRLQVEHPVTEMILGVDLVKAQILALTKDFKVWPQNTLKPRGHAIECRLYAENPWTQGLACPGKIEAQVWPTGPGRRFDYGYEVGDEVTSFYDPMMAKVIVWDENRHRAIQKMIRTLQDTIIFGPSSNIPLLIQILSQDSFRSGEYNTQFMNRYFPKGAMPYELTPEEELFCEKAHEELTQNPQSSNEISGGYGFSGPNSEHCPKIQSPWLSPWSNL